jgi:membrane-associated protease RseP (regulator of RpoE activity)
VEPVRYDTGPETPTALTWQPRPKFQDRVWRHVVLLALTIVTTTVVGVLHYVSFLADFNADTSLFAAADLARLEILFSGFWYSGTILAILGCHELGHYLACRYYDVDASLPFFIPAPLPLTGTLGAFIRIREPIPTKRMLFDIGVAGPIAGFLVAVPALFLGLALSNVVQLPPNFTGVSLGEPLLFQLVSKLLWGTPPEGYSINMHPMAFAAWFGLLATALNLVPIGQLDGGHIAYAVFGRRSSHLTLIMIVLAVGLTAFVSTSWLVWTVLMVAMLFTFGRHHPRTFDEDVPLDRRRLMLAIFALVMLVICFTPAPIEPMELIRP